MLTLAVDTSTDILALALLKDNNITAEYNLSLKRQHSEKLLPLIQQMFELLDIKPGDIDGAAVGIGPGSFTGLRISITAVKLMARILSIPVKGLSTLEITASAVNGDYILPLIDAGRNRVYYSFYQRPSRLEKSLNNEELFLKELIEASSAELNSLPEILADYKAENITVVGENAAETTLLLKKAGFKASAAEAENNFPRAAAAARLGRDYLQSGKCDDIYELKPAYLKKPQAEINWQKKYGR